VTRNPAWTRDELILALDVYVRVGQVAPNHQEVVKLSRLLRELPRAASPIDPVTFRNQNGVARKLANFAGLDPAYKGRGLGHGGRLDATVWSEFTNRRSELAQAAAKLRASVGNQTNSDPVPSAGVAEPVEEHLDDATHAHARAQWQLAQIGKALGLDVWIPRADRNKTWRDEHLGELSIENLPSFGLGQAQSIVENIDVLWIDAGVVQCAFEVEHTTSVYSGILRMSDLVTVQPYTPIRLFIVASIERAGKVARELARPTFAKAKPPLGQICRFLPYEKLDEYVEFSRTHGRYLKFDWVDSLADPVHVASGS
jgi:hypothetical protein